jgi:hypothetical protein
VKRFRVILEGLEQNYTTLPTNKNNPGTKLYKKARERQTLTKSSIMLSRSTKSNCLNSLIINYIDADPY